MGSAPTRGPATRVGVGLFPDAAVWGCVSVHQPPRPLPSPSPGDPGCSQPGGGLGSPVLKPLPSPSWTGVLSGCALEYLDYLTPCMARAHVISCPLSPQCRGTMAPLVLLSPTVPWPGLWLLLCLFQKPEPWTCSSFCGPAGTQPPHSQVLADTRCPWAPVPSSPTVLSCSHTRPSSLAVSWSGYSRVRRTSPSTVEPGSRAFLTNSHVCPSHRETHVHLCDHV